MANAASPISEDSYNRCRAIADERARLLCFENLTAPPPQPSPAPDSPDAGKSKPNLLPDSDFQSRPSSAPVAGKWRLVHTPAPRASQERKDIVSIMTTAELSGSDIDFAGLDLRCADPDFEVLVFLISPLPPQARPDVTINGKKLSGEALSPGTAIRLPREASELARERWPSLPSLSIQVENEGTKVQGIISLEGFSTALQTLVETCAAR